MMPPSIEAIGSGVDGRMMPPSIEAIGSGVDGLKQSSKACAEQRRWPDANFEVRRAKGILRHEKQRRSEKREERKYRQKGSLRSSNKLF